MYRGIYMAVDSELLPEDVSENRWRHWGKGGGIAPGDTLQGGGDTRMKNLWLNLQRTVDKGGRTSKKVRGDTF